MLSVKSSRSEDNLNKNHTRSRFFALPCSYFEALADKDLNSTDKKLLFAIIWFTLGWRKPTNTIPAKLLREFAHVSEKAFYTSRRRLIAFELIRIQEQLPAFDTRGNRRQGHTAYSMLLRPKPYEELDYVLLETVAPQLSGPQLVLWLVIMRNERNGAFWFATVSQLSALTGYRPTAIKEARNVLLEGGLIEGRRGFPESPIVAGYRSLASPIEVESRRWADLPWNNLWYYLQKQQVKYADISIRPHFSANQMAFLHNVYEQSPRDFLAATASITCRLAETGQLNLYERRLMALANDFNRRARGGKWRVS